MGRVRDMRPENVTGRPVLPQAMDPLSEVFGSLRIQDAVHRRVEATAPWGVCYSGDVGLRIRFGLLVRGSAFLKFKSERQPISLSSGDLCIFILNDEPLTLVDHPDCGG